MSLKNKLIFKFLRQTYVKVPLPQQYWPKNTYGFRYRCRCKNVGRKTHILHLLYSPHILGLPHLPRSENCLEDLGVSLVKLPFPQLIQCRNFRTNYGGSEPTLAQGCRYRPVRLYRTAGRYDNPMPTRFLDPIDCSKIPEPVFVNV